MHEVHLNKEGKVVFLGGDLKREELNVTPGMFKIDDV